MTAARCLIGWPIVSDVNATYTPALSGGSWSVTLPLTNLQDRRLAKVARSTDAALTSTKFDIDLQRACLVGVIAIPKHTISTGGAIRARGFATTPIFDSLTVGDAAWTAAVGTPTRVAAAFTCADGVPLDLVGDDDPTATAGECWARNLVFTGNGVKTLRFRVKANTNGVDTRIEIIDTTASLARLNLQIFTTAGVPAFTIVGGTGTVVATPRGDSSYDVVVTTTSITAANTNQLQIFPAGTPSTQGSFYLGAISAWDAITDQLAYDSGIVAVWPIVYPPGSLPVGDPRLIASGGTGKYTAEEAAAVALTANIGFTHVPPTTPSARYWRIEVADTGNTAGYIDLGRLVIANTYQPTVNMSQGAKLSLGSATTRTPTDGGAAVYNDKPRWREQVFTVDYLSEDEALVNFFDMQRRNGTSGQLYFAHNAADTYHMHRRAFLCTMRELSALEYPFGTNTNVPFAVIEEL